jgi:DNA invertase Pin-like site-specific DNA recombinase
MIAAYLRVSSKRQKLSMQREAIEQVVEARGEQVRRWYAEKVSTRNERPELTRLRDDARQGRIAKLYIYRLDRITRGTICEAMNLIEELKTNGCRVETVADGFSMLGPAQDIVAAVLSWAANMEREAIRERIATARAQREASGQTWGRPRRVTPELAERIANMKRKKYSVRKIAERVKLPVSTVQLEITRSIRQQ